MTVTALLPGPKDSAVTVPRQGYAAMVRGRDSVVAGAPRNRAQVAVCPNAWSLRCTAG